MDYILGNTARSYSNTGFGRKLSYRWITAFGAAIPGPESGNKYAGFLQIRYLGK
ncbi:hypothetical protein ACFSRY_12945 [Pontibacter locisalis]|uniref:Uncharacterized protein n=1 Tax=Pontibacter locisalis TaxID=1719035 RepID=A0ABW5IRX8_9BACT